jgi:hypothetical protein
MEWSNSEQAKINASRTGIPADLAKKLLSRDFANLA